MGEHCWWLFFPLQNSLVHVVTEGALWNVEISYYCPDLGASLHCCDGRLHLGVAPLADLSLWPNSFRPAGRDVLGHRGGLCRSDSVVPGWGRTSEVHLQVCTFSRLRRSPPCRCWRWTEGPVDAHRVCTNGATPPVLPDTPPLLSDAVGCPAHPAIEVNIVPSFSAHRHSLSATIPVLRCSRERGPFGTVAMYMSIVRKSLSSGREAEGIEVPKPH